MDTQELAAYIEANSWIKEQFTAQALDYLQVNNRSRKPDKRWHKDQLESQVEKMFQQLVGNVHDRVAGLVKAKFRHKRDNWINVMEKHAVLEILEESIGKLEFEDDY